MNDLTDVCNRRLKLISLHFRELEHVQDLFSFCSRVWVLMSAIGAEITLPTPSDVFLLALLCTVASSGCFLASLLLSFAVMGRCYECVWEDAWMSISCHGDGVQN